MGGEAHPAQVGDDDLMVGGERRGDRRPHIAGVAEAVQTNDGRPMAADPDMDRGAFRPHLPDLKAWRKWEDWHGAGLRLSSKRIGTRQSITQRADSARRPNGGNGRDSGAQGRAGGRRDRPKQVSATSSGGPAFRSPSMIRSFSRTNCGRGSSASSRNPARSPRADTCEARRRRERRLQLARAIRAGGELVVGPERCRIACGRPLAPSRSPTPTGRVARAHCRRTIAGRQGRITGDRAAAPYR